MCFAEAILRDRSVGRTTTFPIEWSELEVWTCAKIGIVSRLQLVDLRGDGLIRMGIPTDVPRARSQHLSRAWSRALWSHDTRPDGIIYDSRLNGETNLAVFDRALPKLKGAATPRLIDCRGDLAAIIAAFDLVIV